MKNLICFDLEGPLSPQDNAYELMGLFKDGFRIFEVLSRYDDILTLEGCKDYEPGDTLSLIIPFLVKHGISEQDIRNVSNTARIVDGVKEVFEELRKNWSAYIISTSFRQHAFNIASQLGIPEDHVYSTRLPLDEFRKKIDEKDLKIVEEVEKVMIESLQEASDEQVKKTLDEFYKKAGKTSLSILKTVKVVGGGRKLEALNEIAGKEKKELKDLVAVGDSITDFKMLEAVKNNNGLAVVFNGNKYALPYGNIGVASSSMLPLLDILKAFKQGGTRKALELASTWNNNPERLKKASMANLLQTNETEKQQIIEEHAQTRKQVRGQASKLG